jgi:hypothetical protein
MKSVVPSVYPSVARTEKKSPEHVASAVLASQSRNEFRARPAKSVQVSAQNVTSKQAPKFPSRRTPARFEKNELQCEVRNF